MKKQRITISKPGKVELVVPFGKEGEEVEVTGIIRADKKGDYELNVVCDHTAPRSFGRVKIRGIAKNGANIRVNGLIKIRAEAQGVEDFLEMKLLILDDKSSAVAEPKLEIEANEVKASHAATVGRISEEELFYLESRGIMRKEAEEMIVKGFLRI